MIDTISLICRQYPGKWIIFNQYILKEQKITYQKDNTLIINQYLLSDSKVNILYEILKKLKKEGIVTKVINEKEFLVIDFKDIDSLKIVLDESIWKLYYIKEYYKNYYDLYFKVYKKEHLLYNKDIRLKLEGNTIYNLKTDKKYRYSYNELVLFDVLDKILQDL